MSDSDTNVPITRPEKVLYPEVSFTKGEVISYYEQIAPIILPHVEGRPMTLHRFPNGVDQSSFYEKTCPRKAPTFVETVENHLSRKSLIQCAANNKETLMWLANLASLEMHPGLSKTPDLEVPTKLTFDLDPGEPATVVECCQVALALRELFGQLELQAFPKTSGSKGLHVDVPLNTNTDFHATKMFAHAIARMMETRSKLVVSDMTKALRKGKVLVDWSQNDRSKTTVAPYSMRARVRPWVSTPLTWDEVSNAADLESSPEVLRFEPAEVLARVEDGDLFEPVATLSQELPKLS